MHAANRDPLTVAKLLFAILRDKPELLVCAPDAFAAAVQRAIGGDVSLVEPALACVLRRELGNLAALSKEMREYMLAEES